jgi:hypothetical protein
MIKGHHCREAVNQLLDHARQLEARNRELVAMLRKHEWVLESIDDDDICWDYCPECRVYKPQTDGKHKDDCQLSKLIGGLE